MSDPPMPTQVDLSPEMARAVDLYRSAHRLASDSEAIARLIALGLEAAKVAAPASRPARRSVGPEDEARSGPEAIERPRTEMDD
jgi:hypothetical protein